MCDGATRVNIKRFDLKRWKDSEYWLSHLSMVNYALCNSCICLITDQCDENNNCLGDNQMCDNFTGTCSCVDGFVFDKYGRCEPGMKGLLSFLAIILSTLVYSFIVNICSPWQNSDFFIKNVSKFDSALWFVLCIWWRFVDPLVCEYLYTAVVFVVDLIWLDFILLHHTKIWVFFYVFKYIGGNFRLAFHSRLTRVCGWRRLPCSILGVQRQHVHLCNWIHSG